MNQKQRTIGFFSLVGLLTIFGTCLIVASCKDDTPAPQAQQQYQQQPQQSAQPIIYAQVPQQEDHFWRDMYLWHVIMGEPRTTVIYHPAPVYRPAPLYQPAPVVNKTVQNITINQTVNHAPTPVPVVAAPQAAKPAVVPTPNVAPAAAPAPSPQAKSSWWSAPSQIVKASTSYPKASNSKTGGYAVKSSGYSSYSQKSSYSSGRRK
jgi:hypothetical protein